MIGRYGRRATLLKPGLPLVGRTAMAGHTTTPGRSVTSRALGILDAFHSGAPWLTLTEIAERSGTPLTTTHRLLSELTDRGALNGRSDGRYEVGRKALGPRAARPGRARPREGRSRHRPGAGPHRRLPLIGELRCRRGCPTATLAACAHRWESSAPGPPACCCRGCWRSGGSSRSSWRTDRASTSRRGSAPASWSRTRWTP